MCGTFEMSLYTDLKNSEISIVKKNNQKIHAIFQFKKELDFFKGHFPENPILPGIFQIELVKYALEKSFDIRLHIKSVKKTKFSSLISAEDSIMLDITINQEENRLFNTKTILKVKDSIAGSSFKRSSMIL